jgi:hypothetical protein
MIRNELAARRTSNHRHADYQSTFGRLRAHLWLLAYVYRMLSHDIPQSGHDYSSASASSPRRTTCMLSGRMYLRAAFRTSSLVTARTLLTYDAEVVQRLRQSVVEVVTRD